MKRQPKERIFTNEQCAEIILRDPKRYPGIMLEWAKQILKNATDTR